jgi:hypothetical protein
VNFAAWLATLGLERHTAGLIATLGVCCALTLLGVACVAWCEGWRPPRQRPSPPRGATRHKPGQP